MCTHQGPNIFNFVPSGEWKQSSTSTLMAPSRCADATGTMKSPHTSASPHTCTGGRKHIGPTTQPETQRHHREAVANARVVRALRNVSHMVKQPCVVEIYHCSSRLCRGHGVYPAGEPPAVAAVRTQGCVAQVHHECPRWVHTWLGPWLTCWYPAPANFSSSVPSPVAFTPFTKVPAMVTYFT